MRRLLFLILTAALGACSSTSNLGDPSGDGGIGSDGGSKGDSGVGNYRAPKDHRATATACPSARGAGVLPDCQWDAGPPPDCLSDGDCTSGTNGRCMHPDLVPVACDVACSYDECATDSDCPAGEPCSCRTSGTSNAANVCLTGSTCRTDADCGPGSYCSPSAGFGPFACGTAYFCHSSSDTCIDDSDCDASHCQYDTTAHHWSCGGPSCAPPP